MTDDRPNEWRYPTAPALVVDPDIDLHTARQKREVRPRQWDLVTACSAGGIVGAWARFGIGFVVPHGGRDSRGRPS
jgi:fluoride exporter